MKVNTRFFIVISVLIAVAGCSSGKVREGAKPVLVETLVPESYPVLPQSDYNIELKLNSALIDSTLMQREPAVQVSFTIWAFDEMVADVAATKIISEEYDLRPTDTAYSLRFSKADLQAVEYQSGIRDALKFYFTFEVDVNGDGAVCNGDYRQDYSASRPEFYRATQTEVERVIEIVEIQGELC